jgi:hypothetical protein
LAENHAAVVFAERRRADGPSSEVKQGSAFVFPALGSFLQGYAGLKRILYPQALDIYRLANIHFTTYRDTPPAGEMSGIQSPEATKVGNVSDKVCKSYDTDSLARLIKLAWILDELRVHFVGTKYS